MRRGEKICWCMCVLAFLFLALDGALHWDEPAYLYTGGFLSYEQIMSGGFQPSGIENFYFTRPLHILMIHWITNLVGVGVPGLVSIIGLSTLSLFGFLAISGLIVRELLPGLPGLSGVDRRLPWLAVAFGLLIPVVPYLAFKSLPESGALLFASLGLYALIKGARSTGAAKAVGWIAVALVTVALTLWLKGPMLLLIGSGAVAVVLLGGREAKRIKLAGFTVAAAVAGLALAYAWVVMLGIDPSIYTGGVSRVGGEYEPISARILNNGTEVGLFLLVVPLAWLSPRRREAGLFTFWFLLSTVPLALLFPSMEARYQSPNVVPLIGLTALALHGVLPWLKAKWHARRAVVAIGLTGVLAFVVFSHALAIAVMQHEVKMTQVHCTLNQLDERYGEDGYALLTAWTYSDFLYLRFVYPDRPIYTAHDVVQMNKDNLSDELMRSSHVDFFPERMIEYPSQMSRVDGRTPVLFGFHENFAAENLRAIFNRIPGKPLEAELKKMHLADHLATTWLWDNPDYKLEEVAKVGHYRAFEVSSAQATKPSD